VWLDADLLVLENLDLLFACELHADPAHPPFAAASEAPSPPISESAKLICAGTTAVSVSILQNLKHRAAGFPT
jgi:hypothetical protein